MSHGRILSVAVLLRINLTMRALEREKEREKERKTRSIIKFPKPSPFDKLPDARMGATVEPRGSTSNVISLSPGLSPFDIRRLYTTAGLPSTPLPPTPSVYFAFDKRTLWGTEG